MINRPVSFFILTFFLLSGALADLKRELKLEWEPIEGASQYELQLTPSESSSTAETQEPLKVKVNEAKWVGSITPGQYKMKIRSFDDRQVPGPWSDEIDVEVKLPFVQIIEPKNKKVIPSEQDKEQSIKFSWKPIYGAKEYEWVITNKDNTITDKKNTEAPELETDLEVAPEDLNSLANPISVLMVKRARCKFSQKRVSFFGELLQSPQIKIYLC